MASSRVQAQLVPQGNQVLDKEEFGTLIKDEQVAQPGTIGQILLFANLLVSFADLVKVKSFQ
jgi:hypothetical protein